MFDSTESGLKFYSFGIVVQDKALTSNEIEVTPIESIPYVSGKLSEDIDKYKSSLPDLTGNKANITLPVKKTIKAIWVPLSHSNRVTSPDVIKNETVILLKFADTDEVYWTTIFHEPKIRRLETVRYSFGNLKDPLVKWDASSSYWMEFSTHSKHIWIKTTKSDGEKWEYDFKIDSREGYIEAKDDLGNRLKIDSRETTNTLENADGTHYIQEKTKVYEHADDSIDVTTKDHSTTAETIKTSATTTTNSSSAKHTIEAPIVEINAQVINFSGAGCSMESSGATKLSGSTVEVSGVAPFKDGLGTPIDDVTAEIDRIWAAIGGRR